MRRVMWFSVGFGAFCGLFAYGGLRTLSTGALVLCVTVLLAAAFLGRKSRSASVGAAVLTGFLCGSLWCAVYSHQYLDTALQADETLQNVRIVAEDYSFETDYGRAADGTVTLGEKRYRVRVYLDPGDPLVPGDEIEGRFRFRVTVPEGSLGGTSHSGKGIFLLAYQKEEADISSGDTQTFSAWASRLRRQIGEILRQYIPQEAYPFAKALLLGDTSELSYAVDTQLKVSGIRHVAAVSGLHVGILFALLNTVLCRNRFASAALGIPVLVLFAALAGFTPSVNRSCIMCGLMLVAMLVDREYDALTALGVSCLVMLLANPLAITSVSLQLSAASVAGIFLFSGKLQNWLSGLVGGVSGKTAAAKARRWLVSSVSVTLGATVLTTPLCAWYFGTVSLIGTVTNLMTLWAVSYIFYGLMGVCLLSLWSGAAAGFLGGLTGYLIRYVLLTAKLLSKFPVACVYTQSIYTVFWLIFVYVLLAVFLTGKNRRPGLFAGFGALGLCLALLCAYAEPMLHDTVITVLDVGQGQCILLQDRGKSYLVDCGGDDDALTADIAAAALLSRGITRLDGLILTHSDRDHAGAAQNLMSRIDTGLLIVPPTENVPEGNGATVLYAKENIRLTWEDSTLVVFGEETEDFGNENSLCILLDTEKCDILITGDRNAAGEARLLDRNSIPDVDVLIAGHHGSKYANSRLLLQTVKPETVCISVGADNSYGHPAPEALARFQEQGCRVYRTDLHGTVTVRR